MIALRSSHPITLEQIYRGIVRYICVLRGFCYNHKNKMELILGVIANMAAFPASSHWRDSARNPRFFIVDARAAFPIFIFLVHIRVWTASLVLISMVLFGIIEHYGFTVPVFLRWLRCFVAGPIKSSNPWWR